MANWETNSTSSNFNANEVISGYTTGRARDGGDFSNAMSGINSFSNMGQHVTYDSGNWWNPFDNKIRMTGYDIVGINGNGIKDIQIQITAYVESVQSYLKNVLAGAQEKVSVGFRGGDAERAVVEYLEKVREYINNLLSGLLAFNDKLSDVGNAWVQAQQNIGSTVNTSTSSFSAGSTYQDGNITYNGPSRQ